MDPIPDRNPHATDRSADYPAEPTTLVEFRLAEEAHGTLLTITESGFERIPLERRARAFTSNEGGWTHQLQLIEKYLEQFASRTARREAPRASALSWRRCSPRWETPRVCGLSADCAKRVLCRSPDSLKARTSHGRPSRSICTRSRTPAWYATSAPVARACGDSHSWRAVRSSDCATAGRAGQGGVMQNRR